VQVTCGVPQGSVLGPLLFLLYINDICEVSKVFKFILFADDTNLFCSGDNLKQLLDTMEKEMVQLKNWFDSNKITLNTRKTTFIVFGSRLLNTIGKLMINEVEIERVSAIKFLGVIIDNNLNWKPHISYTGEQDLKVNRDIV